MPEAADFRMAQSKAGLSNEACASLLGVSVSTVEKRRAGVVRVTNEAIMAIELYVLRAEGVIHD